MLASRLTLACDQGVPMRSSSASQWKLSRALQRQQVLSALGHPVAPGCGRHASPAVSQVKGWPGAFSLPAHKTLLRL